MMVSEMQLKRHGNICIFNLFNDKIDSDIDTLDDMHYDNTLIIVIIADNVIRLSRKRLTIIAT